MASSKGHVSAALLMTLMLLVAQSPRTAEAFKKCQLDCLIGCLTELHFIYPICIVRCFTRSCQMALADANDTQVQCKSGCVMSKCMHPIYGASNDEETEQCVISCSTGCEKGYMKSQD